MRRSGRGIRRRSTGPGPLGWALALLAICFQLGGPALHSRIPASQNVEVELASLLNAHALCVSADASEPAREPASRPNPEHSDHHFAACCPWHGNQGQSVPTRVTV